MSVNQVIESLRKQRGITRTHICKRFGHSPGWYYYIAKGSPVKADDLPKFAEILGVDIDYFFKHQVSDSRNHQQKEAV